MPATLNLEGRRGDTFSHPLTDFQEDGVPMDLSGFTIEAQIRRNANDTLAAVDLTIDMSDAANGNLELTLTAVQTAELVGRYVWDFQWTRPTGEVETIFEGAFPFTEDVTR